MSESCLDWTLSDIIKTNLSDCCLIRVIVIVVEYESDLNNLAIVSAEFRAQSVSVFVFGPFARVCIWKIEFFLAIIACVIETFETLRALVGENGVLDSLNCVQIVLLGLQSSLKLWDGELDQHLEVTDNKISDALGDSRRNTGIRGSSSGAISFKIRRLEGG